MDAYLPKPWAPLKVSASEYLENKARFPGNYSQKYDSYRRSTEPTGKNWKK